jgi:hypothetical protein
MKGKFQVVNLVGDICVIFADITTAPTWYEPDREPPKTPEVLVKLISIGDAKPASDD